MLDLKKKIDRIKAKQDDGESGDDGGMMGTLDTNFHLKSHIMKNRLLDLKHLTFWICCLNLFIFYEDI